jgi:hypothetical protein
MFRPASSFRPELFARTPRAPLRKNRWDESNALFLFGRHGPVRRDGQINPLTTDVSLTGSPSTGRQAGNANQLLYEL